MGFFFPTLFLEINTVFLSRGAPFKKLLTGTCLFLYVWSSIVSYSLARCICSYTIVHSIIHNTKHDTRPSDKKNVPRKKRIPNIIPTNLRG